MTAHYPRYRSRRLRRVVSIARAELRKRGFIQFAHPRLAVNRDAFCFIGRNPRLNTTAVTHLTGMDHVNHARSWVAIRACLSAQLDADLKAAA